VLTANPCPKAEPRFNLIVYLEHGPLEAENSGRKGRHWPEYQYGCEAHRIGVEVSQTKTAGKFPGRIFC
jgi:hypothetical protein